MMLLTILSGCEELSKPDYITVNVICDISVYAQYANDPNSNQPVVDALVNVEIVKAGGERVTKKLKTDSLGNCESVTATFKLYRDQPIAAIANIDLGSVESYYPDFTFNSATETVSWSNIYPLSDFGDTVQENIRLTITGIENQ